MGKKKKRGNKGGGGGGKSTAIAITFGGTRGTAPKKKAPPPDLGFNNALIDPSAPEFSNIRRTRVRGLHNLGNTCFFNSVLQNLASTDVLCAYFNSVPRRREGPLTARFRQFMREFAGTSGNAYSPSLLLQEVARQAPRFKGFHQQDSQELLRYMLDCIDEEEKQQLKRLRESARGSSAESSDTKADGTEPPTPQSESGELQSSGGKNAAYFFDIGEGSQEGEVEVNSYSDDEEPHGPLDGVDDPTVLENEDEESSIIVRIFGGTLCSLVLCPDWRLASVAVDPVLDVSLPLPKSSGTVSITPTRPSARTRVTKSQKEKQKKQKKKEQEELKRLAAQLSASSLKGDGSPMDVSNGTGKPQKPSEEWLAAAGKKKLVEWLQAHAPPSLLKDEGLQGKAKQVCKSKSLATLVGLVKTVWKLIEDVEGDRAAGENSHSAQGEEGVEGGGVPTKSDSGAAASSSAGSEQHCSEAMSGALAEDGGGGAVTASSDIRRGGISRSQIDTWEKEEITAWIHRFMSQQELQENRLEGKPKKAARKHRVEKLKAIAEDLWATLPRDPTSAAVKAAETAPQGDTAVAPKGSGDSGGSSSPPHGGSSSGSCTEEILQPEPAQVPPAGVLDSLPSAPAVQERKEELSPMQERPPPSPRPSLENEFLSSGDAYYAFSNNCKAGDKPWKVVLPPDVSLGDSIVTASGLSVKATPETLYGCLAQFCSGEHLRVRDGNGYRFHFQPLGERRKGDGESEGMAGKLGFSTGRTIDSDAKDNDEAPRPSEDEPSAGLLVKESGLGVATAVGESSEGSQPEPSAEEVEREADMNGADERTAPGMKDPTTAEEEDVSKESEDQHGAAGTPESAEQKENAEIEFLGDVEGRPIALLPSSKQTHLRDAVRRILFLDTPPVLTLHLKRFAQNSRGSFQKINKQIIFPLELDLSPFVLSASSHSEANTSPLGGSTPLLYELSGVVVHQGGMGGGHYVAYVRLRGESGSSWYHISDSSVSEVTVERVLNTQAYILFYQKLGITTSDVEANMRRRTSFVGERAPDKE